MKAMQRLYLTADRKTVVPAGHKKAATLFCSPGDEIPESAVRKFGLVDGGLKERKGREDKEDRGGSDKGGDGSGSDGAPQPDDLTKIAGVGAKTAEALVTAGLASFAAIAAVDPDSPPAVEGLSPTFKWDAVTQSAALLAEAGAED